MELSDRYADIGPCYPEYTWRLRGKDGRVLRLVRLAATPEAKPRDTWVDESNQPTVLPPVIPPEVCCRPLCDHLASGLPAYALPGTSQLSWMHGLDASLCLVCQARFVDRAWLETLTTRRQQSNPQGSAFDILVVQDEDGREASPGADQAALGAHQLGFWVDSAPKPSRKKGSRKKQQSALKN